MINCAECQSVVSDTALKCPMCGVQVRKLTRGFFGRMFNWLFIAFNVLMVFWLFSYWGTVGEVVTTSGSEAAKAGAAVGATIGTGMLLSIWVFGDIILGLFVMFTRAKS